MTEADEKQQVEKTEAAPKMPTRRQILIETDGNNVYLVKAEVGGRIELVGVLNTLITFLNSQK